MGRIAATRRLTESDLRDLVALGRVADRLFTGAPGRLSGSGQRRHAAGAGAEFLDFQPYAPGENARRVDWRASARLAAPVLRRHHDESASDWTICLDRSASMATQDGAKWCVARGLAAGFLFVLLRRGATVTLLAFSGEVDAICPQGRGEPQLRRGLALLDRLDARREGGGSALDSCARFLPPRCSSIVISDFLAPGAFVRDLDRLRKRGEVQALRIADANDVSFFPDGPAAIQDVETGENVVVAGGATGARAAQARYRALGERLADACRRRGIAHTECDAAAPWKDAATRHLRHLSFRTR